MFTIFLFAGSLSSIVSGIFFVCAWNDFGESDADTINGRKVFKIALTVFAIGLFGMIFVPSKQAMIEMLIARNATIENTALTIDALKSAVDYIIEAVNAIK